MLGALDVRGDDAIVALVQQLASAPAGMLVIGYRGEVTIEWPEGQQAYPSKGTIAVRIVKRSL